MPRVATLYQKLVHIMWYHAKNNVFITFHFALGLSFGHLTVMGANRFEWVLFCAIVLQ